MKYNDSLEMFNHLINKGGCDYSIQYNNLEMCFSSQYKGCDCYTVFCDIYISDSCIEKDFPLFTNLKEGEDFSLYARQLPLLINDYLNQKIYSLKDATINLEDYNK